MLALKLICVAHIVWHYLFRIFYVFPYIMWLMTITVTMLSDVTNIWQYDFITLTLTLVLKIELKIIKNKIKIIRVHCFQF